MLNEKDYSLSALVMSVGKDKQGKFYLFPELCKGCGLCISKWPAKTLDFCDALGIYGTPVVSPKDEADNCTACGICQTFCPDCAITINRK